MSKTSGPSYKCKHLPQIYRRLNTKKSKTNKTVINNFYLGNQFLNVININNVTNTNNINQENNYNFHPNKDSFKENKFYQLSVQTDGKSFEQFSCSEKTNNIKKELIENVSDNFQLDDIENDRFKFILSDSQSILSKNSPSPPQLTRYDLDIASNSEILVNNSNLKHSFNGKHNQINKVLKGNGLTDVTIISTDKLNTLNLKNLLLKSPPDVLNRIGKKFQLDLTGKMKFKRKKKNLNGLYLKFSSRKDTPPKLLWPHFRTNYLSSSGTSTPFRDQAYNKRNWEISPIKLHHKQKTDISENTSLEELLETCNNTSADVKKVTKRISKLILHDIKDTEKIDDSKEGPNHLGMEHITDMNNSDCKSSSVHAKLKLDGKLKLLSSSIGDKVDNLEKCELTELNTHISSNSIINLHLHQNAIEDKISDEENNVSNQSNCSHENDKTSRISKYIESCDFHSEKSCSNFDNSIDSNNSLNFSYIRTHNSETFEENHCRILRTQNCIQSLEPYVGIVPGKKWRRSLLITAKRNKSTLASSECHQNVARISKNIKFSFHPQNNNFNSSVINRPFRSALLMNKLQEIKEQSSPLKKERDDDSYNGIFYNDFKGREELDEDNTSSTNYEEQAGELEFTFAIHKEVADLLHTDCLNKTLLSVSPDSDDHKKYARENVLNLCGLTSPINFCDAYTEKFFINCKKIGEGVYGEVFCYILPHSKQQIVFKIIPIEGNRSVNFWSQKTYSEVFSEMCIAFSLSGLKNLSDKTNYTDGFCSLLKMTCLKGKYPAKLIEIWHKYDKTIGSENDSPAVFDTDQLYIALEMLYGGDTLESYQFSSARQSYSILLQVIHSLAAAEKSFEFEHRDLHWGNVLVSKTFQKKIKFVIEGDNYYIPSYGKKSTIIDYTLSRIRSGNFSIYNDFGVDEELFNAYGDYQFDIYRKMRDDVENNWKLYVPKSNVRWIHYLSLKCYQDVHYKSYHNTHKLYLIKIKDLADKVLSYSSAADIVKDLKEKSKLIYKHK